MSVMESMGIHEGMSVATSTAKAVGVSSKTLGITSKAGLAFSSGLAVGLLSGLVVATIGLVVISYVLDRDEEVVAQ